MEYETYVGKIFSNKWFNFILKNKKDWNWDFISSNPNLTIQIILVNPDKKWNWYNISKNSNITMDDVLNNFTVLGVNIYFFKVFCKKHF